jgi:hypothetical protein
MLPFTSGATLVLTDSQQIALPVILGTLAAIGALALWRLHKQSARRAVAPSA